MTPSSAALSTEEEQTASGPPFGDLGYGDLINRMLERRTVPALAGGQIEDLEGQHSAVVESPSRPLPSLNVPDVPSSGGRLPGDRVAIAHRWQCVVQTKPDSDGMFNATMQEMGTEEPEEVAEFYLNDVSESDRELVQPGAVFYVFAGTQTNQYGRIVRTAHLRFRRLPVWTRAKVDRISERAAQLAQEMGITD